MIERSILFVVVFCFLPITVIGQGRNHEIIEKQDTIYWNSNISLSWNQFAYDPSNIKSKLDMNDAISYVGIACRGYYENGLPNFNIQAFFIPNLSYTRDTVSEALLKHEQVHFDIAELVSKALYKEILKLREEGVEGPEDYYNVIALYQKKMESITYLYDVKTRHGLNHNQQLLWNQKVYQALQEGENLSLDHFFD